MKKISLKEKRKLKKETNSLQGGEIAQLMIMTPLMRKKIEENRTIFGNEPILEKKEVIQLINNNKILYLKVKNLKYKNKNGDEVLIRKIDKEFIWNKVLKEHPKSATDYEIIAKEIAKEYLELDEDYIGVNWDKYSK